MDRTMNSNVPPRREHDETDATPNRTLVRTPGAQTTCASGAKAASATP